jgi:uncharacterized protein
MSTHRPFRVRTITLGVDLPGPAAVDALAETVAQLARARQVFEADGYEVETVRIATPPLVAGLNGAARHDLVKSLCALDRVASEHGTLLSIGPVLVDDRPDADLVSWVAELFAATKSVMCSVAVASREQGLHEYAVRTAAEVIAALGHSTPDGGDNFRFAAAAGIPPGTPFFPVAYHNGPASLAIGLEGAPIVASVFSERPPLGEAVVRLRDALETALTDVERLASTFAEQESLAYGGIDPSPAPLGDRSIGAAIESLTGLPFGSASTLRACAIVTKALKSLRIRTCGYAGLMLPVLEDVVLAARASEGRYTLRDLLLYSSVCGTGLDVVPLPGDTSIDTLAAVVGDVATLSVRLDKPLSARLCLVPGKQAGEHATFDNPYLIDCVVLAAD